MNFNRIHETNSWIRTWRLRAYIDQRLQVLRRVAWFYKLLVSSLILMLASTLELGTNAVDDSGIKAAFFALCAACILLVDLLPGTGNRYSVFATLVTRVSGALLAFGAGWYWISSETGDAPLSFMSPYILMLALVAIPTFMGTLYSVLMYRPRQTQRESFPSVLEEALAKEYKRLSESLSNDDTRNDEITGYALALESHTAVLLALLFADPKNSLTRDSLNSILHYANTSPSEEPTSIAVVSLHRRLRMLVHGILGETPCDLLTTEQTQPQTPTVFEG